MKPGLFRVSQGSRITDWAAQESHAVGVSTDFNLCHGQQYFKILSL